MSRIEQPKEYTGTELDNIFFRPMLSGPTAQQLGIKIMYNMPVPTTLNFWKRDGDILQKFTSAGWHGKNATSKFQKTISLSRVKAESSHSAEDYFNLVYELITNRSDINMEDLSGTILEEAETALFKESISESIRATMWVGDSDREGQYSTFDGFLKQITGDLREPDNGITTVSIDENTAAEELLKQLWEESSELLKEFKSQDNLVYLVTSDIYAEYEDSLDSVLLDSAYIAKQNGREGLSYRGIPVIDIQISQYLKQFPDELPQKFAILTDRRNLALAVNTSDFPGTEVKMWYNPDLMENRQRAVFMAGCDYLLPELITFAYEF